MTNAYLAEARRLGQCAGRAAGSWAADGNTDPAHARRVLAMLGDGDPEAYDHLPSMPDLSGSWADGRTLPSVARLVTGLDPASLEPELVDAIGDAWEEGVHETFEGACVRELRAAVAACGQCGGRGYVTDPPGADLACEGVVAQPCPACRERSA